MTKAIIAQILFFTAIISVGLALQSDGLSTKKPRTSKNVATVLPSTLSTYRINNTNGITCILIQTDALLSVQYRDKSGKNKQADIPLPDYPELSGECDDDQSSMSLKAKGFVLGMDFKKTPGGERWYVNNIELSYSTSNPLFENVDRPGLNVQLSTLPDERLYPTPVGKSYACDEDKPIMMYSQDRYDESGHSAKLVLKTLTMQSFMFKAANTWGPEFHCTATGTYRDERAPIVAGSALTIATCGSVAAYGIWRYMKIKNVQYGAME